MSAWYCTREDVKRALDVKETALVNAQIDRAIEAASRAVESVLHRRFYPETTTRYFDFPERQSPRGWRLWLNQWDLISVTSLVSGGTTISSSDYFLAPANSGPPYTHVEIDLSSSSAFDVANTPQRNIAITGTWGYSNDYASAGQLAEALDNSETGVDVSNGAVVGVGSILKCESELMIVTDRTWLTSGDTLQVALTASNADKTVTVTDGTVFNVGETLLIDSEKVLITDISGNDLTAVRAWDGSTLATHTGSTPYVSRTLTVERGALGSTAAAHSSSTTLMVHQVPPLVRSFAIAEALNIFLQESAGYARVAGEGDTTNEFIGRGLDRIRKQAYARHGRKMRVRAI